MAVDDQNRHHREDGSEYEIQYDNGVERKRNYTVDSPEYQSLFQEFRRHRPHEWLMVTLSRAGDKLTAYMASQHRFQDYLDEFSVPAGNYGEEFSVSVWPNGRQVLKVYDLDIQNYNVPGLPEGSVVSPENGIATHGIALQYDKAAGLLPSREIYFEAPWDSVLRWASDNGFSVPEGSVDYWGLSWTPEGVDRLKAMRWQGSEGGPVEYLWENGGLLTRTGFNRWADEGHRLLGRVPKWYRLGPVTNVGINEYNGHDIISVYMDSVPSREMLSRFNVPRGFVYTGWLGLKYCPELDCEWLKLADERYELYNLPDIPDGSFRAFGVAMTFAASDSQPAVHNMPGEGWRDCSFVTRDHGSVRRWCREKGIPDPKPDLPNSLNRYGVYSITHKPEGEIGRLKFYSYDSEQYEDMEAYARYKVEKENARPREAL